jgi:hypothetical protein
MEKLSNFIKQNGSHLRFRKLVAIQQFHDEARPRYPSRDGADVKNDYFLKTHSSLFWESFIPQARNH